MNQRNTEGHRWQDLQRENNLLHVARIRPNRARRARDGLTEYVVGDEPAIQIKGERNVGVLLRPPGLEDMAEHKHEDAQHNQHLVLAQPLLSADAVLLLPQPRAGTPSIEQDALRLIFVLARSVPYQQKLLTFV